MRETKRVILLEFNELTPSLMRRFMDEGHLPNFTKFYDQAEVFTTDAEEAPGTGPLNPWVQWVSVHSGLTTDEHGILRLSDGHKLKKHRIWDVVSQADLKIWICGSMNAFFNGEPNGFILPDPWSENVAPYPEKVFEAYDHFVRTQVQEHTNRKVPLSRGDYWRFLKFMMTHGLSVPTVTSVMKQLVGEKMAGFPKWRRATLMDRFQFDVFRYFWRKHKPHLSTFFLNSTAHFQHQFWRDMDPEPFQAKAGALENRAKKDAILFGYRQMDELAGRFLKLVGDHTALVFATGLSQQPCLKFETTGGKRFYRPFDFKKLFNALGMQDHYKVVPVMSEEFHLYFDSEPDAEKALALLKNQQVNGEAVFTMKQTGKELFGGCRIHHDLPKDARLRAEGYNQDLPFFEYFYQAEAVKSGMHHPDGMLWIRQPYGHHREHTGKVGLTRVAPTILDLLRLGKPPHMKGKSLLSGES